MSHSWTSTLQRQFVDRFFSIYLGATTGDWMRELKRNRFSVSPRHWARAAYVTMGGPLNSLAAALTERKFSEQQAAAKVERPVFILGHWRSGTTYLQRLFSLDPQLGYPTMYEVLAPRVFPLLEKSTSSYYNAFMPPDRIFDKMTNTFADPGEDEFAVALLCGLSPCMSWLFPKNRAFYDRFLTFHEATADERETWKQSLDQFLRLLTVHWQRPLVLKSPAHTARIRLLREMYPDARFVHIHRDPYRVFSSTCNMVRFQQSLGFQHDDSTPVEDMVLSWYRQVHEAFWEDRGLLPSDQFIEISYRDLTADPRGTLEKIYGQIGLGGVDHFRPKLDEYLSSIRGYETNKLPEIASPWRERIGQECQRVFQEWGYAA
jgi:hypothetical protein